MEFSLDDLIEEVEGALKEGSPTHPRSVRGDGGHQHSRSTISDLDQQGNSLAGCVLRGNEITLQQTAAVAAATAGAAPANTTVAKEATATTVRLAFAGDDFDSDPDSPEVAMVVPGAICAGFDCDSPIDQTEGEATFPAAIETSDAHYSTAADVEFDSDSSPMRKAVVAATGTAADIDFDSDSSEATPIQVGSGVGSGTGPSPTAPMLAVSDVTAIDSNLDCRVPAKRDDARSNGGIDEALGSASDVRAKVEGDTCSAGQPTTAVVGVQETASESSQPGHRPCVAAEVERNTAPLMEVSAGRHAVESSLLLPGKGNWGAEHAKARRRCGTVLLGGAATERGFCATSMSQRACDSLRCTDCNFEVLCFAARAWEEGAVDYLFLRNNVPDQAKLCARLLACSDACAYACQCSWQTVKELRVLQPTERPRWACGGHLVDH